MQGKKGIEKRKQKGCGKKIGTNKSRSEIKD
jgi:hypothetical protein